VQWSVVRGEVETGISIMSMDEGLDTGPVYLMRATPIDREDTAAAVYERLTILGADALIEALPGIISGALKAVPQDGEEATLAPILSKEDGLVDWNRSTESIRNLVRGMEPWPGAHTFTPSGLRVRMFPHVEREPGVGFEGPPGMVLSAGREGVLVRTGDGALLLGDLQPAGSRRMAARDLIAGRRLAVGDVLGAEPGEGVRTS
jgi:methionyl-tRNA formyltransferase